MTLDAGQLGIDGTLLELRQLLVSRFGVANSPDEIEAEEPLFSAGVGLSSMEGMELLLEIEQTFNVQIDDVEAWVDESPNLIRVAQYIVERSSVRTQSQPPRTTCEDVSKSRR